MLGVAVTCTNKQTFITKIQSLDETAQVRCRQIRVSYPAKKPDPKPYYKLESAGFVRIWIFEPDPVCTRARIGLSQEIDPERVWTSIILDRMECLYIFRKCY